jgi:hypothetical protein
VVQADQYFSVRRQRLAIAEVQDNLAKAQSFVPSLRVVRAQHFFATFRVRPNHSATLIGLSKSVSHRAHRPTAMRSSGLSKTNRASISFSDKYSTCSVALLENDNRHRLWLL